MGAEPTTPAVDNDMLATLVTQLIAEQQETNRLLRNKTSEWVSADDAARMLGKTINTSGTHTRVLTYLRNHDKKYLKTFGQLRPYTYLRSEVDEVVRLVKNGLVLP